MTEEAREPRAYTCHPCGRIVDIEKFPPSKLRVALAESTFSLGIGKEVREVSAFDVWVCPDCTKRWVGEGKLELKEKG